jgi:hypothetical protein
LESENEQEAIHSKRNCWQSTYFYVSRRKIMAVFEFTSSPRQFIRMLILVLYYAYGETKANVLMNM